MNDFKIIIEIDVESDETILALYEKIRADVRKTSFKDYVTHIGFAAERGEGEYHIEFDKERDGIL